MAAKLKVYEGDAVTTNDDDANGMWRLAMPLAVTGFVGFVWGAAEEGNNDMFRVALAFLVLTVVLWVRFRRLETLIRGKR